MPRIKYLQVGQVAFGGDSYVVCHHVWFEREELEMIERLGFRLPEPAELLDLLERYCTCYEGDAGEGASIWVINPPVRELEPYVLTLGNGESYLAVPVDYKKP